MARIIVKKAKKEYIEDLGREVVVSKFQRIFINDSDKDVHTSYGIIAKEDLKKKDGSKLLTDWKKEFTIYSPSFIDKYKRIERLPQIIPLKDIGQIVAICGLGKESRVIDTGTGSGGVACFLGNICKEVYSYELKKEHYEVSKKNVSELGFDNVVLKNRSALDGFDETEVDTIILDLPAPWEAINSVNKSLKIGGFLVSYSPTIPQVMDFVQSVECDDKYLVEKTIEVMERQWQIEGRTVRPKSKSTIHSGFLVFVRKIG